jgi:hypothetical protein
LVSTSASTKQTCKRIRTKRIVAIKNRHIETFKLTLFRLMGEPEQEREPLLRWHATEWQLSLEWALSNQMELWKHCSGELEFDQPKQATSIISNVKANCCVGDGRQRSGRVIQRVSENWCRREQQQNITWERITKKTTVEIANQRLQTFKLTLFRLRGALEQAGGPWLRWHASER